MHRTCTHVKDVLTKGSGITSRNRLFAFRCQDHRVIVFFDQALGDQFLNSGFKGGFLLGVVMDHFLDVKRSPRHNFRYVFGWLSRPYRVSVTPPYDRRCLFHVGSLILSIDSLWGSPS
jgi:hypothetical protein